MQITAIRGARRYFGDRLFRTTKPHKLLDPEARPLIAVRLNVLARKNIGRIADFPREPRGSLSDPPYLGRLFTMWDPLSQAQANDSESNFGQPEKQTLPTLYQEKSLAASKRRILLINDGNLSRPMKTTAARLKVDLCLWQTGHCVPERFESTGGPPWGGVSV